jgi:hypothetical protein
MSAFHPLQTFNTSSTFSPMRLAWLATALLMLVACDSRPDQWDAFIYPDFERSDRLERINGFKTFELCRGAALDRISELPDPSKAQFECGYRCGIQPGSGGLNICKETRD